MCHETDTKIGIKNKVFYNVIATYVSSRRRAMIRSFHSVRPSIWVDRGGGRGDLPKFRNKDDEGKREGKEGNGSGGGRTLDLKSHFFLGCAAALRRPLQFILLYFGMTGHVGA